jgi:hypothetical protein
MVFTPNNQAREVLRPGEQSSHFVTTTVSTQRTAVLGRGLFPSPRWGAIISIPAAANSSSGGSPPYVLSPIGRSGNSSMKLSARVSVTRETSCGEADVVFTARGDRRNPPPP